MELTRVYYTGAFFFDHALLFRDCRFLKGDDRALNAILSYLLDNPGKVFTGKDLAGKLETFDKKTVNRVTSTEAFHEVSGIHEEWIDGKRYVGYFSED